MKALMMRWALRILWLRLSQDQRRQLVREARRLVEARQ